MSKLKYNKSLINFLIIIFSIIIFFNIIHIYNEQFNFHVKHMISINKIKLNSEFTTLNGNNL